MDSKELSQIRHFWGKTQDQLARLLCVSPKAIQSFEQTVLPNGERTARLGNLKLVIFAGLLMGPIVRVSVRKTGGRR